MYDKGKDWQYNDDRKDGDAIMDCKKQCITEDYSLYNGDTVELIKEIPDGSSIDKPIMGEFGILVPDMDEEENFDPEYVTEGERILAEQMEKILDDEELLKKYSDKSFERAAFYAPDKYKESIHEILKRYE